MKKNISRRDFIKGAAAGAVGVATMGLLGACSGTEISETSISAASVQTIPVTTTDGGSELTEETSALASKDTENSQTASWRTAPAAIDDSEIDQFEECDVLVIGLGHAGTCAVRAAAEAGAKVMAFEKRKKIVCPGLGAVRLAILIPSF